MQMRLLFTQKKGLYIRNRSQPNQKNVKKKGTKTLGHKRC